jgi:hypothetical protein
VENKYTSVLAVPFRPTSLNAETLVVLLHPNPLQRRGFPRLPNDDELNHDSFCSCGRFMRNVHAPMDDTLTIVSYSIVAFWGGNYYGSSPK